MKMKIGREPERDLERAEAAKSVIGDATLFVDANGAYDRKQALGFAEAFARLGRRLVRGAGVERRSRGAPGCCATARRARCKSRRANTATRPIIFARCWKRGGRRPAGRRHPLRRDHRFLRAAASATPSTFRSPSHCGPAVHVAPASAAPKTYSHGVVSRPRAHRAHAVRWRPAPQARRHRSQPFATWTRADASRRRRAKIRGLMMTKLMDSVHRVEGPALCFLSCARASRSLPVDRETEGVA